MLHEYNQTQSTEIHHIKDTTQEDLETWQNLLKSYKRINQLLEEGIASIKTTDISSSEIQ